MTQEQNVCTEIYMGKIPMEKGVATMLAHGYIITTSQDIMPGGGSTWYLRVFKKPPVNEQLSFFDGGTT